METPSTAPIVPGMNMEWAKKMLQEKQQNNQNSGGDIRWISPPDNTDDFYFRLLPWGYRTGQYGFLVYNHWNLPENCESKCLQTWGLECPVCGVVNKYAQLITIDDWVKSAKAYFNALVLQVPADPTLPIVQSELPHILRTQEYTLFWLLEKLLDRNYNHIIDPINGHDMNFHRKKQGGKVERDILLKPRSIGSSPEAIKKIQDACYDLQKIWRTPDENFIKEVGKSADALELLLKSKIAQLSHSPAGSSTGTGSGTGTTQTATPEPPAQPASSASPEPPAVEKPASTAAAPVMASTAAPAPVPPMPGPTTAPAAGGINKPPKAPECYGNFVQGADKCTLCPFDFNCQPVSVKK
jgi:hypothetical protein